MFCYLDRWGLEQLWSVLFWLAVLCPDLSRQQRQQRSQKEHLWAAVLRPIRPHPAVGVARAHHPANGAPGLRRVATPRARLPPLLLSLPPPPFPPPLSSLPSPLLSHTCTALLSALGGSKHQSSTPPPQTLAGWRWEMLPITPVTRALIEFTAQRPLFVRFLNWSFIFSTWTKSVIISRNGCKSSLLLSRAVARFLFHLLAKSRVATPSSLCQRSGVTGLLLYQLVLPGLWS